MAFKKSSSEIFTPPRGFGFEEIETSLFDGEGEGDSEGEGEGEGEGEEDNVTLVVTSLVTLRSSCPLRCSLAAVAFLVRRNWASFRSIAASSSMSTRS